MSKQRLQSAQSMTTEGTPLRHPGFDSERMAQQLLEVAEGIAGETVAPATWQPEAIAERLKTEAQPDNDVSFGDGFRYRFGQVCELAVYPHSGTVIFRSGKK